MNKTTPKPTVEIKHHPNGAVASKTCHINDKKHGKETLWYDNGAKQKQTIYKNDTQHGHATSWYYAGSKSQEAVLRRSKMHGTTIARYKNGHKRWQSVWKNGERNGVDKWWREDGTQEREIYYIHNKEYARISWDKKRNVIEVNFPNTSINADVKLKKSYQGASKLVYV